MGWRSSAGLRLCDGGTPGSKTHAAVAPCVSEMISSVLLWFPLLYPSIAILMTTHTQQGRAKKKKGRTKRTGRVDISRVTQSWREVETSCFGVIWAVSISLDTSGSTLTNITHHSTVARDIAKLTKLVCLLLVTKFVFTAH